jgi:hypothetical protein
MFKRFKPPPSSSPASLRRTRGRGLNGAERLNDLNVLNVTQRVLNGLNDLNESSKENGDVK